MTRTNRALLAACLCVSVGAAAQALPPPLDEGDGAPAPSAQRQVIEWERLAPPQREDLRARYRAWRGLDEAERAEVRRAQARLAALPPEQRQALRARFDAMDRLHRHGWRLGPRLGAHYPQLQPLFGYVPRAQREMLLALLRGLDEEQLAQLSVISQRTPPPERDALRRELLATSPAARGEWLRLRAQR